MFTASQMQKILRRDFDCDRLVVRWNEDVCRYEVGEIARGVMTHTNWFHVVANEDNSFRPLDKRLIGDLKARDKSCLPRMTAAEFGRVFKRQRQKRDEKWSEHVRYKAKHELRRRFVKWADENM